MQAEATNDVNLQISQIEQFINDGVDAIVLLPFDGAALTEVATKAMEAGHPRHQRRPRVRRTRTPPAPPCSATTTAWASAPAPTSASSWAASPTPSVAEIAGIDSLPLTQDRSQGFEDALADCGLEVSNRVAADFTVQGGEAAAANLLQAAPQIDAIWNHDDDQGVGVMAAIENAGRDEFFMVGGAGSKNVMEAIKADDSVLKATVIYPSTQAADGIKLARLLVQGKSMSDLVEVEVPRTVQLYAPVVTKENVDQYLPTAFES